MKSTVKIGWIGAGILGSALIETLNAQGYKIKAFNRTQSKLIPLAEQGVLIADSPSEVFEYANIIFACLTSNVAFEDLILSTLQSNNFTHNKIIVDLSTIEPSEAINNFDKLKQFSVEYIECPVSGGKEGARNRVMTSICAGNKETFSKIKEIINKFSKHIHYVGPIGNAQTLKIINNLAEGINLTCAAEVISLGLDLGIDIEILKNVLSTARGKSVYMDILLSRLSEKRKDVDVTLQVRKKDLDCADKLIKKTKLKLNLSNSVISLFTFLNDLFGEDKDQSECFSYIKNNTLLRHDNDCT